MMADAHKTVGHATAAPTARNIGLAARSPTLAFLIGAFVGRRLLWG